MSYSTTIDHAAARVLHPAHACPPPADTLDPDGATLTELLEKARATWPDVHVPAAQFAQYLRERIPDGEPTDHALRGVRTSDLYLACACSLGDAAAIAALDHHYLDVLDRTLVKIPGVRDDHIDDIKQQLRRKLLVNDGRPPRILEFSGRADLRRWLRVLAVREALTMMRGTRRELLSEDDAIEQALLPVADTENAYFKRTYQHEFVNAVTEAMAALTATDQVLLRQRFVDDLSIDEIGRLYLIHRATAARWVARAQQSLADATRAILMSRLTVNAGELEDILQLLRSGLEISLRLVFARKR